MWWLLYVALGIIVLLFLFAFVIGYFMCRYYARPITYTYEDSEEYLKKQNAYHDFDKVEKENIKITLKSGYVLNGYYIKANEESKKFLIICHGFSVSQTYTAKYYDIFRSNGYNIISYDERNHGKNEKTICGMSRFESLDLLEVIDYAYDRFGKDIFLGLHGESMGAASVLQSFEYTPNIKFAIADCPFARLKDVSIKSAKDMFHMPKIVVDFAGPIGKIFFGYNPNKNCPIDNINNSKVPLLLCHGDSDNLIPISHSYAIYDKYESYKELYVTKGADHAESVVKDYEGYKAKVTEFLKKIEEMQ